jgi:hypothetical protein
MREQYFERRVCVFFSAIVHHSLLYSRLAGLAFLHADGTIETLKHP